MSTFSPIHPVRHLACMPAIIVLIICATCLALQAQSDPYDSGGPLLPEQAAYDVTYYDLALTVTPADSSIAGRLLTHAKIVQPTEYFVLDLDTLLRVSSIIEQDPTTRRLPRRFERRAGRIWIQLDWMRQAGEEIIIEVAYAGRPRVAPRPPWDGGFTWAHTPEGAPWIATTCQGEGADVWWPCKDHVSDKSDSMSLQITVPNPLVVASNGRLLRVEDRPNDMTMYHWFISTPINAYNVALNIAPYRTIYDVIESPTGEKYAFEFYVLPQDYDKGVAFVPEIKAHLRFYEETLGPYPFRADKYGVAQTPHLGMEHQTIIAYGANFNNGAMTHGVDWGFDALHHHELAHEWWGNLVTNADWRDMWLHEGFATYMQALYLEQTQGKEKYHAYLNSFRPGVESAQAIAPRQSQSASEIYTAPIYTKGAWVLHTLRYVIGDKAMHETLRRMAFPRAELERVTDGRQCRFSSTDEFRYIAESISQMELDWLFEVYLRQPELPRLVSERSDGEMLLRWEVPDDLPFPMPVVVEVNGQRKRIALATRQTAIKVKSSDQIKLDPENWILKAREFPKTVEVPVAILESYAGTYQTRSEFSIVVTRTDNQIFAQFGHQPPVEIFPKSPTEFFAKHGNFEITFESGGNEKASQVTLHFRGHDLTANRVDPGSAGR